jgi:hypothetical protein
MAQITNTQLLSALDAFRVNESDCGDLIADTKIYIAPLFNCATVAPILDLTPGVTALNANSVVVTAVAGLPAGVTSVTLERGTRVYFTATPHVVAAQTVLTATGGTIPVEPTGPALTVTDVASILPRAAAVNVGSASLAMNIGTEDTGKTAQGRRNDKVVTTIAPALSGDMYLNLSDRAVWGAGNIFDAVQTGSELFIYREVGGGEYAICGRALVTSFDDSNDAQTVVKISYQFDFQSDFVLFKPFDFNAVGQQTSHNLVRRLWGLTELA